MEYKQLGKSGLKISKIVLGAAQYGNPEWQGWVLDEKDALPLLKYAYDKGINTWDTADVYSNGVSERIVGRALTTYSIPRSRVVIFTKCFFAVNTGGNEPRRAELTNNEGLNVNQGGLSRKHIFDAVEASVERLGTYIDVLQIHRLDRETPREEIMKALNDVVEKGWVRYLGASSMAAWEFQALQNIALTKGYHPFISMQNYHNLLYREEEREMIPYCADAGIGLIPWSPLARGALGRPWTTRGHTKREQTDQVLESLVRSRETEVDKEIVDRLEKVSKESGKSMAQTAIAWNLHKGDAPIVGLGSRERIDEAVNALGTRLSEEQVKYLEEPYRPKEKQGY